MKTFIIACKALLFFTVLTGLVYPLTITGIGQLFFPHQANGSLIYVGQKLVGSELIGQQVDDLKYFLSRPSVCNYAATASGGSNLGVSSLKLHELVMQRANCFQSTNNCKAPSSSFSEMAFASASGLDPHISVNAALAQLDRVCQHRSFNQIQRQELKQRIQALTEEPQFRLLGNQRINVLLLNIETDRIK
jgi:K+-transporting ATPase ATPase C chain